MGLQACVSECLYLSNSPIEKGTIKLFTEFFVVISAISVNEINKAGEKKRGKKKSKLSKSEQINFSGK